MQKIKTFLDSREGKDILVVLVIILVGIGSFSLGRLSKNPINQGLMVEYMGQEASVISSIDINDNNLNISIPKSTPAEEKAFFGSSKGSKYYPLGCSAGKSIKLENRVYFKSAGDAESAGYTLSSSC